MTDPYDFQRDRQRLNKFPRAAQPNTYQPNQKKKPTGWIGSSKDYWVKHFEDYLKGRG